ncbi:hypothetical protein TYRP_023476 [Tyrophagus putrescentiae]|nr:hypothetical protein TYRP_023476 [Tyrophagus putrescentiae]
MSDQPQPTSAPTRDDNVYNAKLADQAERYDGNTLEANAFTGLASLLRLSLYGNRIVTVSPASFLCVGVNLTRINLGGNQLATVPTEAIRPLIALQRLQLQENSIRGPLSSGDFARLGSAASLDVLNLANK